MLTTRVRRPQAASVLLMPSLEADEIEVAKRHGIREENIYVVDDNPAIVASVRRRYARLPTVPGCHGVDVATACKRLAEAGVVLHALNLDLTSCVSFSMFETLWGVAASGVLHREAAVAVTALRGRESGRIKQAITALSDVFGDAWRQTFDAKLHGADATSMDLGRVGVIGAAIKGHARSWRVYKSGNQTMMWVVMDRGEVRFRTKRKGYKMLLGAVLGAAASNALAWATASDDDRYALLTAWCGMMDHGIASDAIMRKMAEALFEMEAA